MYGSEPLSVEHTIFKPKYKDRRSFNLKLPLVTLADEGKKILFVLDHVSEYDKRGKTILAGDPGTTLENMVNFANKECEKKIQSYKIVNFDDYDSDPLIDEKAKSRFKKRLEGIITDYEPDCVVFMGETPFKVMVPDENLFHKFGRLNFFQVGEKRVKYVFTLSMTIYGTTEPKWFGVYPNLIGFGVEHIQTAIRGKNLYNIQKEVDADFKRITVVDTIPKFKKFFKELLKSKTPAIDTEGPNLNRINTSILSLQFYLEHNRTTYFIPYAHRESPFKASELEYIRLKFKYYFERKQTTYLIFHNAQHDLCVLRSQFKIEFINHRIYDTMAGAFSLDENSKFLAKIRFGKKRLSGFSLESLEFKYGYVRPKFAINKENRGTIVNQPLKDVIEYASVDSITTYWVHFTQIQEAKRRGLAYKRFLKIVCEQIGDMIHMFVECELNGTPIDKDYLFMSRARTSPINKLIEEQTFKLRSSKAILEANNQLLKETGTPRRGLYTTNDNFIFKITKPAHRDKLFFQVMKLQPISVGKNGKGQVDKKFQVAYKEVPEVALFTQYQGSTKLRNTYINGIWKILTKDEDARIDGRFRCRYNFTGILTGRAGATNGLHQIPTRGQLAKYIKRQFIAPVGQILLEMDYSAHEVRLWGNTANDNALCKAFRRGLRARQRLRIANDNASLKLIQRLKQDIEKDGDIHASNYYLFFNRFPKNKAERNSVKALIFGTIYSIGKKKLGTDLKAADLDDVNSRISAKKKEIQALEIELNSLKIAA